MRASVVLLAVCGALALLTCGSAWADETAAPEAPKSYPAPPPETPAPLPPRFDPSAEIPLEPVAPVEPLPPLVPEVTAESVDAAAEAVTAPGGGCVAAVCDPCRKPCGVWVRLEALSAYLDSPTGLLGPNTGNPTQMRWDDLEYDPEVAFGGRLTVGFYTANRWRYLLSASVYGRWEGTSNQTGVVGARTTPGGPVITSVPTSATLESKAELWSGEFHAWRTVCDRSCVSFDVGAGARYTAFDEEVSSVFAPPFPVPGGPPALEASVDNRYIMGQVGALVSWKPGWRWNFFGSAKGLFGFADRNVRVQDNGIFVGGPHTSNLDDSEFGWGVDAELGVEFSLSRAWSLNLGYQFLLMDPVIRANDALDLNQGGTGAVQAQAVDDTLMVHAVFFGVTWRP